MEVRASRWDMYASLREAGKTDKEAKGIVDREFADKDEIIVCVEGVKDVAKKLYS